MSYLITGNKLECCGCRACVEMCPQQCIVMKEDEETFLYPVINNELCTNCGLCSKVCPESDNSIKSVDSEQLVYVAINKDDGTVIKSSSGGAFSAIIESLEEDYVFFGVSYDENLKVKHDSANTKEEYKKFLKSKYVQSDTNGCFKMVKNLMDSGKNVLFSGTPCQVAALKKVLGNKEYDNLILIDLVCHGVPSQKMFDMHLAALNNKKRSCIGYVFRNKKKFRGFYNSRSAEVVYSDGTSEIVSTDKDAFLYAYYTRLNYRPICGVCKYANTDRISDITLGDAWGIEEKYPELNSLKGVSLVIANTQKGKNIVKTLLPDKMIMYPLTIEWARDNNAQLKNPTTFSCNRKKFFELLEKYGFEKAAKKIMPSKYKKYIKKVFNYFFGRK